MCCEQSSNLRLASPAPCLRVGLARAFAVSARSLLVLSILLGNFVAPCTAQTTNDSKPTSTDKKDVTAVPNSAKSDASATKQNAAKKSGVQAAPDDLIRLLGPNGELLLIPRSETWDEFQKFLKSREGERAEAAPFYSVNSVSFEGTVERNEDTTTLQSTVTISLNHDDRDVLVPLRLNEATLLKFEHTGPGEAQFEEFDRDAGYRCWLRGKGQHELKLTLAVPVRRQVAPRRLLLSLPLTAVSNITLNVPLAKVSAKGPERGVVRIKPLDNGRSEIQASWVGGPLDLSWQSVAEGSESKSELQASTFIAAELRAESLVLEATQAVRSIQGTFEKFTVRLPPEFELLDVSGTEIKETAVVPGSPPRVAVTLVTPTSGPVVVKWTLSAKVPANTNRLPAIEGFEAEDARRQIGLIAVTSWEGVNLRKRDGEDRFVQLAGLSELRDVPGFLPPAANSGLTTAYRFHKQPFRLVLDVQKIEPYFSAEPTHVVQLTPGRADLETTLRLRVSRGSLLDVALPWPAFKTEGWEKVSTDTPETVERIDVEDTPTGSLLKVRLVDRKSRVDGDFELRLKSRRVFPADGTPLQISLPLVAASGQKASKIIVAPSGNLEVEWTPADESVSRPTTPDDKVLEALDSPRNASAWQWETGSPTFLAKAKIQQQTIRTESVSELAFENRTINVTQRIHYDVAFEGLSQLRLMVPKTISDRVRFSRRDGTAMKPLTPVFTGQEIDQQRQFRLHFEQPQLGKFELLAEFEIERPVETNLEDSTLVAIPVIQSSDAEFTSTRVKWRTGEKLSATLEDSAWKPELASDKTALWTVPGARNVIAVKVTSLATDSAQDFTVHRAIIRSVISEGRAYSQAMYDLDRDVRDVTLFLPPQVSSQDFRVWWNQKLVEPARRNNPTGEVELRIKLPPSRDKNKARDASEKTERASQGTLWVTFYSQTPTRFSWNNSHQLAVPNFAATVWVAQTVWEVVLPSDQHLFTTPRDFAAQFHWQRSMLLWSRVPNAGYDQIENALSQAAPPLEMTAAWDSLVTNEASGNVYPVSCFGPPQMLVFWTMSRSAVVGCGAGLALLLGFVLIRMPATRHVLTFLVVGFAMALTALWFAEPVKVLLQPATLGAVMAVAAAMIDRVGRRGQELPLMTLSSPSDFYASSSIVKAGGLMVSAEAPTTAPQPVVPSEPISASGSGGHS